MWRDRSSMLFLATIIISSAVLVAGLATFPVFFGDGDLSGDWELAHVRGYDTDGDLVCKEINDPAYRLSVTDLPGNAVELSAMGSSFTGSANGNILRIKDTTDNIEIIGNLLARDALNLAVAIHDPVGPTTEVYSLVYTRDGKLPKMIDYTSLNLVGDWNVNSILGTSAFSSVSATITSQDVSVSSGTVTYGGAPTEFKIAYLMMGSDSTYFGISIDGDGNFRPISVKKGLMIIYCADMTATGVTGGGIYMTRNPGTMFVEAPIHLGGTVWNGTVGTERDGTAVAADAYSLRVTWQEDHAVSGKLIGNGDEFEFVGVFMGSPYSIPPTVIALLELYINIGGNEVRAVMFIPGTGSFTLTAFQGDLPLNTVSMDFVGGSNV